MKNIAEELKNKLATLQKQAKGSDPAKTLQALDHLSKKLQNLAKQSAEKTLAQAEKWNRAEKLATQLSKMAKTMKPTALSKSMKQLSKMLQQMMNADPKLAKMLMKGMPKGMMKAMKKMSLKRSHLKHVPKMCKGGMGSAGKRMGKLAKLKLISGKALKRLKKLGKGPGRGGITRGPGEAPMFFSKPRNIAGVKVKPTVLPPATVLNLLSSQRVGMSIGKPTKPEKPGVHSTGGVIGKPLTGQSGAHTQKYYPQHLGTIKRYFQRAK